jgi:hypothetical protein
MVRILFAVYILAPVLLGVTCNFLLTRPVRHCTQDNNKVLKQTASPPPIVSTNIKDYIITKGSDAGKPMVKNEISNWQCRVPCVVTCGRALVCGLNSAIVTSLCV